MKVFLSHSTRDKDFATQLAESMRQENFDPWLCETSIDPATNWVDEINKGLQDADLTLLIWSPDAANSLATRDEWSSAYDREITERRLRLGVVLLRDQPLPPLLRTRQFIDARRDAVSGIAATMQWLCQRKEAGRNAGSKAPIFLPDFRPENLIVRRDLLNKLRSALVDESGLFLLSGEPGAGKSTLALMFTYESQKDFDAVVHQVCGDRPVEIIVAELADQLRGPLGDSTKLSPHQKVQAIKQWLRDRRSLLVLDDIWPAQPAPASGDGKAPALKIADLIPGGRVSVLFTSRQRSLPWITHKQRETVEAFTPDEAIAVFALFLGEETVNRHRAALLDLANRMGRLPIAVTVSADLLRKQFGLLDEAAHDLALKQLRNEVHSVPDLFQRAIESQGDPERRLLTACAICLQEGFWLPLAVDIAGLSKDDGNAARDNLANASLLRVVDQERQRFQLHALLREQVLSSIPSEQALRVAHAAALEHLFLDRETRWKECRECLEEIIPAAELLWRTEETDRESWLTYCGYSCARRIGELDAALRILRQEESFYSGREDGDAKNALQRIYGNQALIFQAWGRLEEAMALHKKEEALCLELGNKDGLQASYGNQTLILKAWGRLEEAMALHKKQEALCLELGNKASLGICYGSWGLLARQQGNRQTEVEKLKAALVLFTELKMPRECDAVQAELDKSLKSKNSAGKGSRSIRGSARRKEEI
jgi:hypothetical protein